MVANETHTLQTYCPNLGEIFILLLEGIIENI